MAAPNGAKIAVSAEKLFRQVHPNFFTQGRVSSQAFRPTPKDEGLLSIARESLTSAEGAFQKHVNDRGLTSAGTWAVTVQECASQNLDTYDDPLVDDGAHGVVDFRALGPKDCEKKSKVLVHRANLRGKLFP